MLEPGSTFAQGKTTPPKKEVELRDKHVHRNL